MAMREPTADECNTNARVVMGEHGQEYTAIWYPQMGGYVAKCWLTLSDEADGCFGAYIFHDGDFPFSAEADRRPAHIHHCDPGQFIDFGQKVRALQENSK